MTQFAKQVEIKDYYSSGTIKQNKWFWNCDFCDADPVPAWSGAYKGIGITHYCPNCWKINTTCEHGGLHPKLSTTGDIRLIPICHLDIGILDKQVYHAKARMSAAKGAVTKAQNNYNAKENEVTQLLEYLKMKEEINDSVKSDN